MSDVWIKKLKKGLVYLGKKTIHIETRLHTREKGKEPKYME